jgi:hypothetical protein
MPKSEPLAVPPDDAIFLRTAFAAAYLLTRYGEGNTQNLVKLRHLGGGPCFRKLGGRTVVYEKQALDAWAQSRLSPEISSTADASVKRAKAKAAAKAESRNSLS